MGQRVHKAIKNLDMLKKNLKKNDTNELIYRTETDSQIQRMNLRLPGGKGWGEDILGV